MRPLSGEDTPTVVAIVALRSSRPLLVEIVYFGAPTASLEALVADVGQSFTSSLCLTYFALRIGVVVAACLPRWGRARLVVFGALAAWPSSTAGPPGRKVERPVPLEGGGSLVGDRDELDRDTRPDEEALEEIRLLFARYRRIARHGMVTEQNEQTEPHAEDPTDVPALAGR
jgi:hypothetical protein